MFEDNMKLTSEQTLTEALHNFQTYLKTLSIPVDLLTRKNEAKKLETEGDFETNVKAVQDSLVASLKVVENPVRCYYSTASGYHMNAYLYDDPETGKVKSKKTLDEGVDNTSKKWYTKCIDSDKRKNIFATFTEPYADLETGSRIMTVSQGIEVDSETLGVAGMDISFSTVEEYVQNIQLLNTGYVLLVDAQGNILVDDDDNTYIEEVVTNQEFWQSFLTDIENAKKLSTETEPFDDMAAYSYSENIDGNVFYVTVLEDQITEWKLIGLIRPDLENATNNSQLMQAIIIAIIVGLIIGVAIALVVEISFSKAIKTVQLATDKLANGDFSTRIKVSSKDEIGELQDNFNSMTESVSKLIQDVEDKFADVFKVAGDISEISETTKETTNQVANAIQSVATGATEQAQSTQEATSEVDNLANSLEETKEYVESINKMSNATNELSSKGILVVG